MTKNDNQILVFSNIGFEDPLAAMQAHEAAIYTWLTQFKVLP